MMLHPDLCSGSMWSTSNAGTARAAARRRLPPSTRNTIVAGDGIVDRLGLGVYTTVRFDRAVAYQTVTAIWAGSDSFGGERQKLGANEVWRVWPTPRARRVPASLGESGLWARRCGPRERTAPV
jgi:hypothetical protein